MCWSFAQFSTFLSVLLQPAYTVYIQCIIVEYIHSQPQLLSVKMKTVTCRWLGHAEIWDKADLCQQWIGGFTVSEHSKIRFPLPCWCRADLVVCVEAAVNPRERYLSCLGNDEKSCDAPQRVPNQILCPCADAARDNLCMLHSDVRFQLFVDLQILFVSTGSTLFSWLLVVFSIVSFPSYLYLTFSLSLSVSAFLCGCWSIDLCISISLFLCFHARPYWLTWWCMTSCWRFSGVQSLLRPFRSFLCSCV